jgi:ribonuclease T2
MQNGRRMLLILAAVFIGGSAVQAGEGPRDFTLALTWQPAFCELVANRPECRRQTPERWDARNLALHGLWPNVDRDGNGRLDANDNYCLPEPQRGAVMEQSWQRLPAVGLSPEIRAALDRVMPGTASLLERHQWIKHGTCSGLEQPRYFRAAIDRTDDIAGTRLSAFVAENIGDQIARRDLLASFEAEFGKGSARALRLRCDRIDGQASLSEIRLLLRTDRIEASLSPSSLAIPAKASAGNCPARFRIDPVD